MPDAMDHVQQLTDDLAADALKRHRQRAKTQGRTHCANLECGEPISQLRQQAGAQLCLDCQREEEEAERQRHARRAW